MKLAAVAMSVLVPMLVIPLGASAASPQDAVAALKRLPGGGLTKPIVGNSRGFRLQAVDQAGAGVDGVTLTGRIIQGPNAPTASSAGSAVACTTTASDGSAGCGFTPQRAGTDTIRVHVDQSGGSAGVHDPSEPFLDAVFTTEPAPNTTVTEARVLTMDPESTGFSSRPDTLRSYVATVRDRTGLAVQGVVVEFTEEGAGALEGRAASITRTTDDFGRAQVLAGSYGDVGTQVITGRIATTGTECDKAADDPSGAPAGACADTSTVTYCPDCGPTPPPPASPAPGQDASASPSPSSTAKPACASANFTMDRPVIKSGETVTVTAQRGHSQGQSNEDDSQRIEVRLERITPPPSATVRSDSSTATFVTWPLRLGESHNFSVSYHNVNPEKCFPLGAPNGFGLRVDVQPVVSIAATRNAPRNYSFTGRIQPAKGQTVTLYRHEGARRIITAQSVVAPNGTYRIDRRFTGSGQFGFSVAVKESTAHLAGSSVVRPTVIH